MYTPVRTKRISRQEISDSKTVLAPVLGWNARDPEALMKPGYAIYLDNWWPTPTEVQLRKGAENWATGLVTSVLSLMPWTGTAGSPKLFAATASGIFDVTSTGAVGAAAIALTNGKILSVNYTTTGGSFLLCVNGVDTLKQYNGAAWSSVATYTIGAGPSTLATSDISNLNVFKRMLFFIKKSSMSFFYMAVDTVSGSISEFPLGGLFAKGGYLVAMGTWTVDGGSGVDDFAVFVTSEGQLAVYQGTDPASASTWALRGVYDLSSPLGLKCFLKFGGELLYLSRDGVFPISKFLQSVAVDRSQAITDLISNAFADVAASYGSNYGWQGVYSFTDSVLLFNVPIGGTSKAVQFAMNSKSGAWARFTGWSAYCFVNFNNQLYMGLDGVVAKAWYNRNDFGGIINCYAKAAYDYLGLRGRSKKINLLRPNLRLSGVTAVNVAIDMDFQTGLSYGPSVFSGTDGSLWGTATWGPSGNGIWGAGVVNKRDWITVAVREGYAAAIRLRVLAEDATVGWTATDFAFERGAIQG